MGPVPGARQPQRPALFFVAVSASAVVFAAPLMGGCSSKPVATVNGQSLSDKEFHELCETTTQMRPGAGTVGMQVLAQWIQSTTLEQEAKKLKVYPSDAELKARMDAFKKQAAFSGANFDEFLTQQGLTANTFKRQLLNSMIMDNVMFRGINVSDAEVDQAFEKRKAQFSIPEQIKISQITVDTEAKAKKAKTELNGNAQFALVANTYSMDSFAQAGGQVPMNLGAQVQPGGPVAQPTVDAAFKLKPGQVSEPIKVGATWVIVKLEDKIAEKRPEVGDIRELIRASLRQEKAQAAQAQVQENQRGAMTQMQTAKVEINRPEYQVLANQLKQGPAGPQGTASLPPGGPPPPPGG